MHDEENGLYIFTSEFIEYLYEVLGYKIDIFQKPYDISLGTLVETEVNGEYEEVYEVEEFESL